MENTATLDLGVVILILLEVQLIFPLKDTNCFGQLLRGP